MVCKVHEGHQDVAVQGSAKHASDQLHKPAAGSSSSSSTITSSSSSKQAGMSFVRYQHAKVNACLSA